MRKQNLDETRFLGMAFERAWAMDEGRMKARNKALRGYSHDLSHEDAESSAAETMAEVKDRSSMERAPSCSWGPSLVRRAVSSRHAPSTTTQAGEHVDPLNLISNWQTYHAVSLSPAAKDALANILSIEGDIGWDNALFAASDLCLAHEDLSRAVEIRNLIKNEAAKNQHTESARRIAAALDVLVGYGTIDGAHHKSWTIDQAIRALCGVPVGPNGFCGTESNEEYRRIIDEHRTDSEGNEPYSWDVGVMP